MAELRFKQVDVFTRKPFLGNPVAVVLDTADLTSEQMQRIATWTNLSETTFVLPPLSVDADYRLRIFTPKQELPFAGHPTLGSAHAVLESGVAVVRQGKLRQESQAGIVELSVETTDQGERILLKSPQAKIAVLDHATTGALASALGDTVGLTAPALRVDVGVVWLIAQLMDGETVAALKPDMERVSQVSLANRASGITAFGKANDGVSQIHVRSFAPALGVAEDPVCGSGNASVAAFLIHSGLIREFGAEYLARQGMQVGRDGQVAVHVQGDVIRIGGYAVTCVDGTLIVD
ncbi:MAG TPA: PhzF family phenazine biosynthesis protein [Candidatus Limnocylindrales bacterium]|nr:PhzF family phenazine biosynthesis protein [Candidatus Limnocylindrales bacterium]